MNSISMEIPETTETTWQLTDREQEIKELLLEGMALKEIANALKISFKTVDFHRGNLYRKLGIQSYKELFTNRQKDFLA